ncbi:matrixin family metalloprotease, partial [bacterium]
DLELAITRYQHAHGLKETGALDDATRDLAAHPRCGIPDYYTVQAGHTHDDGVQIQSAPGATGTNEFVTSSYRWNRDPLTYSFDNLTGDLNANAVKFHVGNSFRKWAAVTNLGFSEVGSGGNLRIAFVHGDHGDGSPFDGPGRVLAHAYFPSDGRVHFDEGEQWVENGGGVDLASVAIHEIGHAIGLNHSPVAGSVMFAAYSRPNRDLTNDDIQGAKAMYGLKPIAWSSAGPIGGRFCTKISEGADPHTWQDNYLCSTTDYGIRWSSAGAIGGMRCTQITEGAEPPEHTWNDNFLCVPNNSSLNFVWSSSGPIWGRACVQWDEGADPHTWQDNFLCY